MNIFKRARTRYILHRHAIAHDLWLEAAEKLVLLQGMTAVEKAHLRELCTLFLYEKKFFGAQEFLLTDAMCVAIAIQACLPVLRLGISCLSGWTEIIVYPGAFRISRDDRDEAGGCSSSGTGADRRVMGARAAYIVMGRCGAG
ncbi:MAG TPA: zinc-dependent peptidase [Methylobacter sp.]|jgi:hypothetical protein